MTQEKKVQVATVMNVTDVERAAQDAVRAVRTMADGIAQEGERAGKGLEAMGEGAEKADRRVETATKSLGDRLRRLTQQAQRDLAGLAAATSGGAGSAAAFEYEAVLRGANVAKLQPQIAILRELQTHTQSLAESMRQAVAGEEFIAGINQRVAALQRQALATKASEAEMLALRAAGEQIGEDLAFRASTRPYAWSLTITSVMGCSVSKCRPAATRSAATTTGVWQRCAISKASSPASRAVLFAVTV